MALANWVIAAPKRPAALLAGTQALFNGDLRSADPDSVNTALILLTYHGVILDKAALDRSRTFLTPLVPALDWVVATHTGSNPGGAVPLIERVGVSAHAPSPALKALAASRQAEAYAAVSAFAAMAPADPMLHAILVAMAQRGDFGDFAALLYARVAGAAHKAQAVDLLIKAIDKGSCKAIDPLLALEPRPQAAISAWIGQMLRANDSYARSCSFLALANFPGIERNATAMQAMGQAINARPEYEIDPIWLASAGEMGVHGQRLLPAIEARMTRPMTVEFKAAIRTSVDKMQLPKAHRGALLERLRAVPVKRSRPS